MSTPSMDDVPASQAIASTLDWMARASKTGAPINCSEEIGDAIAALGLQYARQGRQAEFAASLFKFYAIVTSRPVLHGTDEDVYALSLKVREGFYSEVMRFRRAILADIGREGG